MLTPGQSVERYVVESEIGEGGMAVVYRVRHAQLGTLHALKVLTLGHTRVRERFLQEGRVQARLRHPNIVTVHDLLEVQGAPALLMEYVEGPSLDGWLGEQHPTLDQAERIFRGVVAGVAEAHRNGLVHRDLKPANVLLAGPERLPKVADFGLVKLGAEGESGATQSGMTMGTPAYMAPEQIRDAKRVDSRADLFSLGCILYELVTGRPPFVADDLLSLLTAVSGGDYEPLAPEVPARIRAAVEGCLRVDPDERIPDCAALLAVLDEAAPAAAPLPGAAEPEAKSSPQAGLLMAAAGTSALVLTGVGALAIGAIVLLVLSIRVEVEPTQVGVALEAPALLASEPCSGADGEIVGWANHRGLFMKRRGATWVLPAARTIYRVRPTAETSWAMPDEQDVVCELPKGTRIELAEAPVPAGTTGVWIPIAAGSFELPDTDSR